MVDTGLTKPGGGAEKTQPPSYMKDVLGVASGFQLGAKEGVEHLGDMALSKAGPLPSALGDILRGHDYWGRQEFDPRAPMSALPGEAEKFAVKRGTPFFVRGAQRFNQEGAEWIPALVGAFFAGGPASTALTNTPFQKLIYKYQADNRPRGPIGPDEAAKIDLKKKLLRDYKVHDSHVQEELASAIQEGQLTERQVNELVKKAEADPTVYAFSRLHFPQALAAIKHADYDEKLAVWEVFADKAEKYIDENPSTAEQYTKQVLELRQKLLDERDYRKQNIH